MVVLLGSAPRPDFTATAKLLTTLGARTSAARTRLNLSAATQAAQMGIGTDTLLRLEAGANSTRDTILAVLRWLATHDGGA